MSSRGGSARLFVAVDPPEPLAEQLSAWARTAARALGRERHAARRQSLRLLEPELLHATVCFLGERPLAEVPALTERLGECRRPAVELSLGAPLWLPPRRPRALAVELHDRDGKLAQIHAELTAGLQRPAHDLPLEGEQPPGHAKPRRFHPHITVARMRPAPRGRSRRAPAPSERAPLPPTPPLSFQPPELVLYRSRLSPDGASYEALTAFALGRAGAEGP